MFVSGYCLGTQSQRYPRCNFHDHFHRWKMRKTYLIPWLKVQKIVRKLAVITAPLAQSLPA